MATLLQLAYLALGLTSLFVLRHFLPHDDREKSELWRKIDKVGVPSGALPWTRATFASWTALARNAHEGYKKFSKRNRPFALPTMWTGEAVVVLPPSALHLTNRPDSELVAIWALVENLQLLYFLPDRELIEKAIHFEVSRKDLTQRNVSRQLAPTAEELDVCFRTLWGNSREWRTVNGWDMCGQIVARVALRTLLGYPACRNAEVLKTTQQFANHLFAASAMMNCMPSFLRPVFGPLMALPTKLYRQRYRKAVVPLIRERIEFWKQHEKMGEGELPSDFLQWIIPRAAQHGSEHLNPSKLCERLLAVNTMFVFAMSYVFAHCVIDICASPDRKRFLDGMAEECQTVTARHDGGLASKDAVEQFYRVESAIRESMRLSDVGVVTMPRDVVGDKPLDLGNGIVCPPGTRLMYPTQPMHLDPELWPNPLTYNAFRFSDPFEKAVQGTQFTSVEDSTGKERERLVDVTNSFFAWGYGKKACPGRWYASQTIKQAMAYMVMNYDVELIGERPKSRQALLNMMVPPTEAKLRFRRRAE